MKLRHGAGSGMQTGWFGRYLYRGQKEAKHFSTPVHVVNDGEPFCGAALHRDMEFQFCASGVALELIECGNCKRRLAGQARGVLRALKAEGSRRL